MGANARRFSDRNLILAAAWRLLADLLSRYQEELGRDLRWLGAESWENRERLAAYLTGRRTRLPLMSFIIAGTPRLPRLRATST